MRRTSGRPASATSIGMAIPVSSSSAPMAGFCTITLNTGAVRSGNTSRRRSWNAKHAGDRAGQHQHQGHRRAPVAGGDHPAGSRSTGVALSAHGARPSPWPSPPRPSAGTPRRRPRSRPPCRPDRISTSPPRSRPRPTWRISKLCAVLAGDEHHPVVVQPLHARPWERPPRCPRRPPTGSQAVADMPGRSTPVGVGHRDPHRDGARGDVHLAADPGDLAGQAAPGQRREASPGPPTPASGAGRPARRPGRSATAPSDRRCETAACSGSTFWPQATFRSSTVPAIGARSAKRAPRPRGRARPPNARSVVRAARSSASAALCSASASSSSRPGATLSATSRRLRSTTCRASSARAWAADLGRPGPPQGDALDLHQRRAPAFTRSPGAAASRDHPALHRRAHLGVGVLVHLQLAQQRHPVPAGPGLDRRGASPADRAPCPDRCAAPPASPSATLACSPPRVLRSCSSCGSAAGSPRPSCGRTADRPASSAGSSTDSQRSQACACARVHGDTPARRARATPASAAAQRLLQIVHPGLHRLSPHQQPLGQRQLPGLEALAGQLLGPLHQRASPPPAPSPPPAAAGRRRTPPRMRHRPPAGPHPPRSSGAGRAPPRPPAAPCPRSNSGSSTLSRPSTTSRPSSRS